MKKLLTAIFLFGFGLSAHAWTLEKDKTFKGDVEYFSVIKNANGAEIYIDWQKEWVVFTHGRKILDDTRGIKVNGEFIDANGNAAIENDFKSIIICRKEYQSHNGCYDKILKGNKIEVNVKYYSRGYIPQTFTTKKVAQDPRPKQ